MEQSEKLGVVVKFNGLLEGRIPPECLHEGSLFNG